MVELHPRQRGDVAAGVAISGDAGAAPRGQVGFLSPHRAARHGEQEARIDAVIAGLDAMAAQHAGGRPFPGSFRAVAAAHEIDHARDDIGGRGPGEVGGRHARTDLDAFAASGAGIEHVVDALVQGGFEAEVGHGRRSLGNGDSIQVLASCCQPRQVVSLVVTETQGIGRLQGGAASCASSLHKTGTVSKADPFAKVVGLATRVGADPDLVERAGPSTAK